MKPRALNGANRRAVELDATPVAAVFDFVRLRLTTGWTSVIVCACSSAFLAPKRRMSRFGDGSACWFQKSSSDHAAGFGTPRREVRISAWRSGGGNIDVAILAVNREACHCSLQGYALILPYIVIVKPCTSERRRIISRTRLGREQGVSARTAPFCQELWGTC